jgi:hypothetical protein
VRVGEHEAERQREDTRRAREQQVQTRPSGWSSRDPRNLVPSATAGASAQPAAQPAPSTIPRTSCMAIPPQGPAARSVPLRTS